MQVLEMVSLKIILTLVVVLGFIFCEEDTCIPEEIAEGNVKRLALATNHLAVNLHQKLSSATNENVFFSPFTISTVLTMLYSGARGKTAEELRMFLGFDKSKLEDPVIFSTFHHYLTEVLEKFDTQCYTINSASAMLVDSSFHLKADYRSHIMEVFQAYVDDADIARDTVTAAGKLNTWVKKKSRGTIKSLVDGINPATALLLVSAAYFKGAWKIKFDPMDTKYHVFYNGGRKLDKSDVLMMHSAGTYRYYEEEDDFQAIELSYEGRNISMVIFLPLKLDGLQDMEEFMSPAKISYVRRYMYYTKVHLTMPKFKLTFDQDLNREMQELGVRQVFGPSADLSGMTEYTSGIALDEVKHKAMIEINEKGSVAASISSMIMTRMIPMPYSVPEFTVNHPFLFAIIDTRTELILFMGRINKL